MYFFLIKIVHYIDSKSQDIRITNIEIFFIAFFYLLLLFFFNLIKGFYTLERIAYRFKLLGF